MAAPPSVESDTPHNLLRGFIAQSFPEVFLRDKDDHLLPALWQNLTSNFTGVLIIGGLISRSTYTLKMLNF